MRRILVALANIFVVASSADAQTGKPGVEGKWEGTLGGQLRLVLDITRSTDGLLLGTLISVDQGGSRIPIDRVSQSGDSIVLDLKLVDGRYAGIQSADGTRLTGTWVQNGAQPLNFTRVGAPPAPVASAPAAAPPRAANAAFPLGVDVAVPIAPAPALGPGKTILAYELNLTNLSGLPMLVTRIEAFDGAKTLASVEGGDLNSILFQAKVVPQADQRSIDAGARATAFMWIELAPGAAVPKSIRHRITAGSAVAETSPMLVSAEKPIVIGPPLHGTGWAALNGPSNTSAHRRALIAVGGRGNIAQRFAIDWVKASTTGARFSGDALNNKSYLAYGSDAVAVLDGVVVETKDSIPENVPGVNSRAVPITLETIGGNHVILDIGNGHYAFYAHLQPGSLRVKVGDHVKRGQVLGLVGNSGNSTEPHLHFHITNGASPLGAEGIPYVIDSWDEFASGAWAPRRSQLPLQNAYVRFP